MGHGAWGMGDEGDEEEAEGQGTVGRMKNYFFPPAPCSLLPASYAQCPMPHAQCPMPNAQFKILLPPIAEIV